MMSARILLNCALGEDISERKIPYHHGGKVEQKFVSFVLLQTFEDCLNRMASPHVCFFPILRDIYIFPYEREVLANCREIRKIVSEIVNKRRKECQLDPTLK